MERSRGCVDKLEKPGGSFWASWEEHHGLRCLHVQYDKHREVTDLLKSREQLSKTFFLFPESRRNA